MTYPDYLRGIVSHYQGLIRNRVAAVFSDLLNDGHRFDTDTREWFVHQMRTRSGAQDLLLEASNELVDAYIDREVSLVPDKDIRGVVGLKGLARLNFLLTLGLAAEEYRAIVNSAHAAANEATKDIADSVALEIISTAYQGAGWTQEQIDEYSDGLWYDQSVLAEGFCFLPDTKILLADGALREIKLLKPGMEVASFDPSSSLGRGKLRSNKIARVFKKEVSSILRVGDVGVTPGHHYLDSTGNFREIAAILQDDEPELIDVSGDIYYPDGVTEELGNFEVYNFEVERDHTYIAGGLRVHNTSVLVDRERDQYGVWHDYWYKDREDGVRIGGVNRHVDVNGDGVPDIIVTETVFGPDKGRYVRWVDPDYPYNFVNTLDYGQIATVLGSSLGNFLFDTDTTEGWISSVVFNATVTSLGGIISDLTDDISGSVGEAFSDAINGFDETLAAAFQGAAVGSISSFLTIELGEALGLEGFGAELFNTAGSSVLNTAIGVIAEGGGLADALNAVFSPEALFGNDIGAVVDLRNFEGGALASAIGGFLGRMLGEAVITPETEAGVILSNVGSAFGTFAFSSAGMGVTGAIGQFAANIGLWFSQKGLSTLGNIIVPGIGAFIGFVLGAIIGNLFGRKKPKIPSADAETLLNFDTGYYELGSVNRVNGGNVTLVRDMAESARDTLNTFISLVNYDSKISKHINTISPTQTYGHTANQIWIKVGGGNEIEFDSADRAVDYGILWALRRTKIVGGNLYLKRVVGQSKADSVTGLVGDLSLVQDYLTYINNRPYINSIIFSDDPDASQVGAAWLITLQRADELGINTTQRSDFYGGFGGFSDSLQILAGGAQADIHHEDLILTLDGTTLHVDYGTLRADGSNLLRGGDLSHGTDILQARHDYGGGVTQERIERIDGANAIVLEDTGYSTWSSGSKPATRYELFGGDLDGGSHYTVEAGEQITWGYAARRLQNMESRVSIHMGIYAEDGTRLSWASTYNSDDHNDGWQNVARTITVPTGGVYARLYLYTLGDGANGLANPPVTETAVRDLHFSRRPAGSTDVPGYTAPVYERFDLDNFFGGGGFADMPTDQILAPGSTYATGQGLAIAGIQQQIEQNGENTLGDIYFINFMGASAGARPNTHGNDLYISSSTSNQLVDDTHTETWAYTVEVIPVNPGGGFDSPVLEFGDESFGTITVTVSGGDDVFITGSGDDTLYGRDGDDWLNGGSGDDVIYGGAGNDVILGGGGTDSLHGDDGDDYIAVGAGRDYYTDVNGTWTPFGARGGNGNDTLVAGDGLAYLSGDTGDDLFIMFDGDAPWSRYDGGTGSDTLSFERHSNAVTISLTSPYYDPANTSWHTVLGDQHFINIENLTGSNHNDLLTGDTTANVLRGLAGDDTLQGGTGSDTLEGGLGADYIQAGSGRDVATYENSYSAVWVDLDIKEAFGGEAEGDTFSTYSTGFTAVYDLIGSDFADTFKGHAGNNYLWGGKGDDWFIATTGSDKYYGDEDFDTVDYSEMTSLVGVNLATGVGSYAAAGQRYYDIEHVVGSDFNDSIIGRASKDDYFTGGKGNDYLAGGTGNDTYIYNKGDGLDTISEAEFDGGYDVLVFGDGIRWNDLRFHIPATQNLLITFAGSSGDKVTINNQYLDNRWEEGPIDGFDVGGVGTLDISALTWIAVGSTGNNTLYGGNNKRDFLQGFSGNDTIYTWRSGASTESNDNYILAGRGNDIIHAGTGDDQYVYELGDGADVINDKGGDDSILFGPEISANDLIYKVSGTSLFVGVREYDAPELEAHQVSDRIELKNAIFGSELAYGLVEYIIAGGVNIDISKIDLGLDSGEGTPPSDDDGGTLPGDGGDDTLPGDEGDPFFPSPDDDPFGGGGGFLLPIAIDLDNDGLDIISIDQSRVVFQSDSGGPLFRVGWLGASDAWLALDRNGNGVIDTLSEISFANDADGATTDLEGLQAYDSNADGVFDASDELWSSFTLWQDANTNGFGSAGELTSLDAAGVTSINLGLTTTGGSTHNSGDSVTLNIAEVSFNDGSTTHAHDVAMLARLANVATLAFGITRPEWEGFDFEADGRFGLAVQDMSVLDGNGELTESALAVLGAFNLTPENAAEFLPAQDFSFLQDTADILTEWSGPEINPDDPQTETFGIAPIVIDLDSNGIDLVNPSQSPLEFDANGDGGLDRIGWVAPNDAILGLDRNGDGLIGLVSEISFVHDLAGATTDLEGLAAYDTNNDGWLDVADDRFGEFRVWQDSNFDAVSTSDELLTLEEAGLVRLSLSTLEGTAVTGGVLDNTIHGLSNVLWSDGTEGVAGDVELRAFVGNAVEDAIDNAFRTAAADRALNNSFAFDPSQRRTALAELQEQENNIGSPAETATGEDLSRSNDLREQGDRTPLTASQNSQRRRSPTGQHNQPLSEATTNTVRPGTDFFANSPIRDQHRISGNPRDGSRWWLSALAGETVGYGDSNGALTRLMQELDEARDAFGKNGSSASSQAMLPEQGRKQLAEQQKLLQAIASFRGSSGASTLSRANRQGQEGAFDQLAATKPRYMSANQSF